MFQRIFDFSNDAVAITDGDGKITEVNQAFLALYGYERGEVIGKNPRILKSLKTSADIYAAMWRDVLDPDKGYWKGEIVNKRKDGSDVPVLLSINAIRDDSGSVSHMLGIASDMSRQKELERINRLYVNYVIHDLRGPLTAIMSNTELLMLRSAALLDDKARRKLDVILSSAVRMNAMTSDILDLARLQGGTLRVRKEPFDFGQVVAEAASPFEFMDKRLLVNGVEFPYGDARLAELKITADRDKIERVVYNLLANAFKHAAAEVRVEYSSEDGTLTAVVANDGSGVEPSDAARLFDPFFQASGGANGGSGLGLTIVKSFVELHGGSVRLEGGADRGPAFVFTIQVE